MLQNRHKRRANVAKLRKRSPASAKKYSQAERLTAPRFMDFDAHIAPTLLFLHEVRVRIDNHSDSKQDLVDLSAIEDIDLAAALALTAEFDRWQRVSEQTLAPITMSTWNPVVMGKLVSLGFFRLLRTPVAAAFRTRATRDWIQFISGEKTTGAAASLLRRKLDRILGGPSGLGLPIYALLVEAMKNAFQHAYPENALPSRASKAAGNRWWMAGTVNLTEREIRIVFLDQGITIPKSLPTSELWEHIKDELPTFADATLIAGAMEYGVSRLELNHRGKGFADICYPALLTRGNYVSVLSRKGQCVMTKHARYALDTQVAFGGTLIEWFIKVPLQ